MNYHLYFILTGTLCLFHSFIFFLQPIAAGLFAIFTVEYLHNK